MNTFKTVFTIGASLALLTEAGWSQGRVTDQHGTTFLMDVLPPTTQHQVHRSRASAISAPAQSMRKTPSQINQSPSQRGRTNIGAPPVKQEVLLNSLLGVVLLPSPGEVRPEGWHGVEGVWHDFRDFPPEVGWALQDYLKRPVSLNSMDQMIKDVIVAYREGDRPVVDVLLPEQDITSGVVQLVVIESKLARVRVEGVDVDTEEYIRSQMRARKGEVIRSSEVLHDLAWINRSPYRKVDIAYAPGYEFGTTDIILKPTFSKKNSYYVGGEDSGTQFLGRERLVAGFNLGEFGNPTQSLAYQFTSDWDFEHVRGHSLVYSKDLPWRHNFSLLASFVDVDGDIPIGGGLPALNTSGFNWQLSPRYTIPLKSKETYICEPLFGSINRTRDLTFGFDFKSNENDLEFGGFLANGGGGLRPSIFENQTEIYQFVAAYKEVWQHRKGVSQLDIAGYFSPGGFSPHNRDDVFQAARAGSSSKYAYLTMGFEHQRDLMQGWSIRKRLRGQLSTGNLQASEQMGLGGYNTVRGFDQYVVRGDEGVFGSVELYAPEISFGEIFDWPHAHGPCVDSLRLLAFFDAGAVGSSDLLPNEPNSQTIAAAGVGLRYKYNEVFNLRVDYGHPVMSDNLEGVDESGRFHIGATTTF